MHTVYIANAFSLNMLARKGVARTPRPIDSVDKVKAIIESWQSSDAPDHHVESVIGHANTARIVSDMLGMQLEANRVSVKLDDDDILLVAQYVGPRLEEGATELPEGARIEWWAV